jgi:hypothetical protein
MIQVFRTTADRLSQALTTSPPQGNNEHHVEQPLA